MATSRYVGLAKEVTVGTYVAPTRYIAIDSETVEPKPRMTFVTRSAYSQPVAAHGYGIPETGDVVIKATRAADILLFLRGFMGIESSYSFGVDTPVAGAGRHTWTDFSNLPLDGTSGGTLATESLTVNYDKFQFRYPGCWFNSLAIRQELNQAAQFSIGVIGSTTLATKAAATVASPPTGKGWGAFDPSIPAFQVKLAGTDISSLVKMFEIRMERGYEPNLFTAGSQQTLSGQTPASTSIRGTIQTDNTDAYAATSIMANLLARTEVSLQAIWLGDIITGSTRERFDLTINNILFTGGPPHMRSGRTPPGYEGNWTFEGYRATAPQLLVDGENATIA